MSTKKLHIKSLPEAEAALAEARRLSAKAAELTALAHDFITRFNLMVGNAPLKNGAPSHYGEAGEEGSLRTINDRLIFILGSAKQPLMPTPLASDYSARGWPQPGSKKKSLADALSSRISYLKKHGFVDRAPDGYKLTEKGREELTKIKSSSFASE